MNFPTLDTPEREPVTTREGMVEQLIRDMPLAEDTHFVNEEVGGLLHQAIMVKRRDLVEQLLQRGADVQRVGWLGHTPLHSAIFYEADELIPVLLRAGARIDARCESGDMRATPMAFALEHCRLGSIRALIAAGVYVNDATANNVPPLHYCVQKYSMFEACFDLLLDLGADVRSLDCAYGTLLHSATIANSSQIIDRLIGYGFDINAPAVAANCFTALHIAVRIDALQAVSSLLHYGANPNVPDGDGKRPLHYAKSTRMMLDLLIYGADYNAEDSQGTRAYAHATKRNSAWLVAIGAPLVASQRASLSDAEIASNCKFIAEERFKVIKRRATDICMALFELELPALVVLLILQESFIYSELIAWHCLWDLVTCVKHWHEKRGEEKQKIKTDDFF